MLCSSSTYHLCYDSILTALWSVFHLWPCSLSIPRGFVNIRLCREDMSLWKPMPLSVQCYLISYSCTMVLWTKPLSQSENREIILKTNISSLKDTLLQSGSHVEAAAADPEMEPKSTLLNSIIYQIQTCIYLPHFLQGFPWKAIWYCIWF